MIRLLSGTLSVLALALFLGSAAVGGDTDVKGNTHDGVFVKAEGKTFTMKTKGGKEHEHTLAPKGVVTCDGKKCELSDLKEGTFIRVTTAKGDQTTALRVEGKTKKGKAKGGA